MSPAFPSTLRYLIPSLNALNDPVPNRTSPHVVTNPLRLLTLTTSVVIAEPTSPSSSFASRSPRRNEHLAVLLPKHLWKVCLLVYPFSL